MSRYKGSKLWLIPLVLSLLFIYEAPIRSLGQDEVLPQIGLLSGFWLSDLGIVIPIIIMLFYKSIRLLRSRIMYSLFIVTIYGLSVAMINRNTEQLIAADIRVLLCFVSGYSLIMIVPNRLGKILNILIILMSIVFAVSIISILASEKMQVYIMQERITDISVFILSGITLSLISPVTAWLWVHNKRLVDYIYLVLLAVYSSVVAYIIQARALFSALLLSVLFSIVAAVRMSSKNKLGFGSIAYYKGYILLLVAVGAAIIPFTVIPQSLSTIYHEMVENRGGSWSERVTEVAVTVNAFDAMDILSGKGLGPSPVYYNSRGQAVGTFHIGILNILWRFGIVALMVVIISVVWVLFQWIKNVTSSQTSIGGRLPRVTAIILCVPGLLTVFFISFMSGGWSQSSFLSLGMLYGLFCALLENPPLRRCEESSRAKQKNIPGKARSHKAV